MVKRFLNYFSTGLLIIATLFIISPVIVVTVKSLEDGVQPYIDFYIWKPAYLRAMTNSFIIALGASAGTIFVSILAAYVFAKVEFRGRSILFYLYIIVMMMPFQVTLLPQYIVSCEFNIYDTHWALILPGIFAPFAVFLLTQMMKSVPNELIEAARLDTGSTWKILAHILIPAIKPGIICTWVLVYTEQWNAVAEPLVLLETRELYPLAVMLNSMTAESLLGFAATVLFFLAPLLLFLYFENEIMEGLGEYRLK